MKLIIAVLILLAGLWVTPWSRPRAMITVTGEAQQQIDNQIARFNVSVSQTDKTKQTAVEAVNVEMDKIIKAVKAFGIESNDLTTQNVSVYEVDIPEAEILIYPPRPRSGEKEWQASNSLEIVLRDVDKASTLTDLLQGFKLAQVFGPSFSLEDYSQVSADLLTQAVKDAKEKAEKIAQASGRKLGKVLTVSEGGNGQPWPVREMAVTSAPVEPGSSQTSKTVTVVFELR